MSRILLQIVVGASLLVPAGAASAKSSKRTEQKQALRIQVMEEVERTLPKGLKVSSLQLPSTLEKQASKRDLIDLRWRRTPTHGRAIVQVLVHKKDGRVKKGWARVEIVRVQNVLVATVDLEAGSIVGAGQLRVEERACDNGKELQRQPSYLLGSRVIAAVKAGETLLSSDVSMPMPIARGTPVRVEVRRGGVVVSASGILESKTSVGTHARVRVAGKLISGKLVRADLVVMSGSSR